MRISFFSLFFPTKSSFPDGLHFDQTSFGPIKDNVLLTVDTRTGLIIDRMGNSTFVFRRLTKSTVLDRMFHLSIDSSCLTVSRLIEMEISG